MILIFTFKSKHETEKKKSLGEKTQQTTFRTPAIYIKIMQEILFKNDLDQNLYSYRFLITASCLQRP